MVTGGKAGIELLHFTWEMHVLLSPVNQETNSNIGIYGFLCFNEVRVCKPKMCVSVFYARFSGIAEWQWK